MLVAVISCDEIVLSYKKQMGSRESWYFLHSILALMEPLPCD